jgi:hypothetical protein
VEDSARVTDDLGVVATASGEASAFQSLPPSWRQNWGLVAEETSGGAEIPGGELWKPRQYLPWKGAGEGLDPEFGGESARGGSQSRVEGKRAGKP